MNILVLEASTTSAKAMLYDTLNGKFQVETREYVGISGARAAYDPEKVYRQMLMLGKEISQNKSVDMISLAGAWHSIMLCDQDMKALTPVYQWTHVGAADLCKSIREDVEYTKRFYQKTGCMVNAVYPFFKLLCLKEKGYRLSDYYILGQGTYNNYRMTGQRVITECLASGTGLLNTHKKKWDEDILKNADITAEQMCTVIDYRHSYPLLKEAADLLGIKSGIPVIPTNSDGGLNQVGVGAVRQGVMSFSVGTSGAIRLSTRKPILPDQPSTWCYLSPKGHMSGAATNGCCNCVDWCKEKLFDAGTSYEEIESQIHNEENTPVFLPFLFGERCPGWDDERKGGFLDLKPYHSRYDMYAAVQEGVLFNLYHCYQLLVEANGKPKQIRFSGGILHSRRWSQMCADIFQSELCVDKVEHGSLLGGAVLAMELAGLIGDVKDYNPAPAGIIRPDPDKAELYKEKFERYMEYYRKQS